ncbi:MAG: cupin domain-containing protein [Candidatus Acidiferrales bacterium]
MQLTAEQIMKALKMRPHPVEGGYFAETYRAASAVPREALAGYPAARSLSTAIYYMLTPGTISAMHRVRGDEMFHFYLGDPVEMLELREDGSGETIVLGQDILRGMKLQHVVRGGVWQGSGLRGGGSFALVGTTMAPGFEYEDYETGKREELIERWPAFGELIRARTKA